jgi:hypothetical protein
MDGFADEEAAFVTQDPNAISANLLCRSRNSSSVPRQEQVFGLHSEDKLRDD